MSKYFCSKINFSEITLKSSLALIDSDKDFFTFLYLFSHISLCFFFLAEDLIFFFADLVFAIIGLYNIITAAKVKSNYLKRLNSRYKKTKRK